MVSLGSWAVEDKDSRAPGGGTAGPRPPKNGGCGANRSGGDSKPAGRGNLSKKLEGSKGRGSGGAGGGSGGEGGDGGESGTGRSIDGGRGGGGGGEGSVAGCGKTSGIVSPATSFIALPRPPPLIRKLPLRFSSESTS